MNSNPIGIIDSGVGGLTVLKEIRKHLPNENIIYIGDTARCPYGDKNPEQITSYINEIVEYLLYKNIKLLIIACNTATAITYNDLVKKLSIPVIGVIDPGVKMAMRKTNNGKIGVIATNTTIRSNEYEKKLKNTKQNVEVISLSCPTFVPLIENNYFDKNKIDEEIAKVLLPFNDGKIDTLILGCTHYPLIQQEISNYLGNEIKLINPAIETMKETKKTLIKCQIENDGLQSKSPEIYVSGDSKNFKDILVSWLNEEIEVIETKFEIKIEKKEIS